MQNNYDLKTIFSLARIKFNDEKLIQDIYKILEFVQDVNEAGNAKGKEIARRGELRADVVKPSLATPEVLKNASLTQNNLIVAPKIFTTEDK